MMKALFHDWNDTPQSDGKIWAYRADLRWPMPEIGESIAIGSEDLFYPAVVKALRPAHFIRPETPEPTALRFALVTVSYEQLPIPLGWPTEQLMDTVIRGLSYQRALYMIAEQRPAHIDDHTWAEQLARETLAKSVTNTARRLPSR